MSELFPQFLVVSLLARFLILPEARSVGRLRAITLGLSQGIPSLFFFAWTPTWYLTGLALVLVPIITLWLCESSRGQERPQVRLMLLLFQTIAGALSCSSASPIPHVSAILELLPNAASIWLAGALLCTKESNLVVRVFFARLRKQPTSYGPGENMRDSTGNGRVIGSLERLLIYTFLFAGHALAVSAVIAVKAFARFKRMEEDQTFAEYVIIGTFLSLLLTLAILGGVQWSLT